MIGSKHQGEARRCLGLPFHIPSNEGAMNAVEARFMQKVKNEYRTA